MSTYNERESGKKTVYLFHFYYNLSLVIYSSFLHYMQSEHTTWMIYEEIVENDDIHCR